MDIHVHISYIKRVPNNQITFITKNELLYVLDFYMTAETFLNY